MKRIFSGISTVLLTQLAHAQGETSSGDSFMGSNLKIYVAISVLAIILGLIFVFLFSLERRLKELEGKQKQIRKSDVVS